MTTKAYSAECDTDYLKHGENVLEMITSNNDILKSLGSSQRDCLSLAMQKSESQCSTFRLFELEFLTLPKEVQRVKGKVCFKKLVALKRHLA